MILPSDIIYTDDFPSCSQYAGYSLLMLCLSGNSHFTIDNEAFTVVGGDGVIYHPGARLSETSSDEAINDIDCSKDFRCHIVLTPHPTPLTSSPQGVMKGGYFHFPMQQADIEYCLQDIDRIRRHLNQPYHNYYAEVMNHLVATLFLDFYDIYARQARLAVEGVSHASRMLQRFIMLLQEGLYRKERSVEYYAARLSITPKYLSEVCVAASGHNATYWIDRFTTEEISRLMKDETKSLNEIALELNFSSASYFSRYVKRAFGCSPSEYRQRLL